MVARVHVPVESESNFYSVVDELRIIRIAFVTAYLMKLKVIADYDRSAYIQAHTRKIFATDGPEFGNGPG